MLSPTQATRILSAAAVGKAAVNKIARTRPNNTVPGFFITISRFEMRRGAGCDIPLTTDEPSAAFGRN